MRRRLRPVPFFVHAALIAAVTLWSLPIIGLFVTSFRDKDAVAVSGWWTALAPAVRQGMVRAEGRAVQDGHALVQQGAVFGGRGEVTAFGISSKAPAAFRPNAVADLPDGGRLTVQEDGRYTLVQGGPPDGLPGQRIFYSARMPPAFTLQNYRDVLWGGGLSRSLLNSILVAVPSTLIPMMIAAFAAHALAWMRFPGRSLLVPAMVGLMAVPLQMALIPLLTFYNNVGQRLGLDAKTYIGIWLAHTGFGLPLAIHVLRGALAGLPREVVESARLDGLSELRVFLRIVLPLTLPALAAFGTFQFIWTWNDLLVALVFLGPQDDKLVLTGRLLNLIGSRGGEWEILAASAFVSMAVPLMVFLGLQRMVVRGLLTGAIR